MLRYCILRFVNSHHFLVHHKLDCIFNFKKLLHLPGRVRHCVSISNLLLPPELSCPRKSCGLKTSSSLTVKSFVEHENVHAHKMMQSIPEYDHTILTVKPGNEVISSEEFQQLLARDWNAETPGTLCRVFERITNYCSQNHISITESMFEGMCQALAVKSKEMSDSELLGILASLLKWPPVRSVDSRNFHPLWSAIDDECVKRIKQWDLVKILYVADHWYQLHLARSCQFLWHSNWKLGRKPSRLTSSQLVQTIFYMNIKRKVHPGVSMFEFEYSFEQCIDKLSVGEIGIIAMGFFKTQTKIHSSNLCYKMLERLMNDAGNIPDITVSAILKVLRYSLSPAMADMLYEVMNRWLPYVNSVSLLTCIHLALAGTNVLVFHEGILKKIAERYNREIKQVRIKDLERFAFVLSLFNYDPQTKPCIFKQIVAELHSPERKEEFSQFPKCVSRCLYYLTMRNIILEEEISQVLDPEYIKEVYGKNMYHIDREVMCLDAALEIECPNYSGHRLPDKTRTFLAKKYTLFVPKRKEKMSVTNRMFVEIMENLEYVLGAERCFYAGTILPHYDRPDIVFYMPSQGKRMELPKIPHLNDLGAIKYPPAVAEPGRWCSIVVGGWNTYISNTRELLGSTIAKLRHLQMVGYSPIYIPWHEWTDIHASARQSYLRQKIDAACTS